MSAADWLMRRYAAVDAAVLQEPLRTRAVVLLAAVVVDQAKRTGVSGKAIVSVRLAALLDRVGQDAAASLDGCGATAGVGREECGYLLSVYGTPAFETVRQAVQETVRHHLGEGGAGTTIADRRPVSPREAELRRQERVLADLYGEDF